MNGPFINYYRKGNYQALRLVELGDFGKKIFEIGQRRTKNARKEKGLGNDISRN